VSVTEALAAIVDSPLYGIGLTLGVFWLAQRLWERTGRHASANPVLVAMALGAIAITVLGTTYEQYLEGARFIGFLLGPATVALALPLHRQAAQVRRAAPMVLVGVTVGSAVGIASGYLITLWTGGTREMALSMAPKSVTTPISLALSTAVGGIGPLSVVFTIVAGVVGAVLGPWLLDRVRVTDQRARGLAIGVASHGIGTTRALQEDETAGAFSGLAMGLGGLVTSLLIGGVLGALGA
jgi:predicted murein hydrolase (TIGR00659 family)